MEAYLKRITEKKQKFDALKPFHTDLEKNLHEWTRIALTYSSNAIEGNTLSHQETAQIIEKNLTIGGKSIVEHLEATNYARAIDLITKMAKEKVRADLIEQDILGIHRCLLSKIDDTPDYLNDPELMSEFIKWLTMAEGHIAKIAADAHLHLFNLFSVHGEEPRRSSKSEALASRTIVDGNGRTARLLMNLLLLQNGYPLTIIEKEKRLEYINAIENALLNHEFDEYYHVIFEAIEKSLDIYIESV